MSHYVTVSTDIDVYLDEIDTDDLIVELERRGKEYGDEFVSFDLKQLVEKIWLNRREGRDYQSELDKLIYDVLGKIV